MGVQLDIDYLKRINWWTRVAVGSPDECWEWKLSIGSHGYGQTWDGQSVTTAQRVAWVLAHNQQIPGDLVVDHMCHNRTCCNPSHLRLLDRRTNGWSQPRTFKTHCVNSHEFTPENTYIDRKGWRRCRACADVHRKRRAA